MRRDLEREPGHLVGVLRPSELVNRVKEDEEGALLGGELQQLLQVGRDGDSVVRNVLAIVLITFSLPSSLYTSKGSISQ